MTFMGRLWGLLVVGSAAACGGESDGPTPVGPTPTSLVVEPSSIRLLIESSIQLEVQVLDQQGQPITDAPLTFSASTSAPFSVSAEGEVLAGDTPGTGSLTVATGDLTKDVPVEVFPPTHPVGVIAGTTQTGGSPSHGAISVTGEVLVGGPILRGTLPRFVLTPASPPLTSDIAEAFSTHGTQVFVARDPGSTDVRMRDTALGYLGTMDVGVGGFVTDLAPGEDEEIVYASSDNGYVVRLDFANTNATPIGYSGNMASAGPIVRRPGSSVIYASMFLDSFGTRVVVELDPADPGDRILAVGGNPWQLAAGRNDRMVYAANGTDSIQVADFASLTVTSIQVGCAAYGLVLTPDGSQLYAGCSTSGEVKIVDVSSRAVIETLEVGGHPQHLAVSPDGTTVIVPNSSGYVTFIQ
jgi:YVTN family beta-propeller protein